SLPPERAALLRKPFLSWTEFTTFAIELYQRINARTDHSLEGWEKSGHTQNEWRLSPEMPWQPESAFLALPEPAQAALRPLISGNSLPATGVDSALSLQPSALVRTRKKSPREVFHAGATQLQRVSLSLLPDLLGPTFAQQKTIGATRSGYIVIQDQDIDPDPMYFPVPPSAFSLKPSA